jgi:hypothetical protein
MDDGKIIDRMGWFSDVDSRAGENRSTFFKFAESVAEEHRRWHKEEGCCARMMEEHIRDWHGEEASDDPEELPTPPTEVCVHSLDDAILAIAGEVAEHIRACPDISVVPVEPEKARLALGLIRLHVSEIARKWLGELEGREGGSR